MTELLHSAHVVTPRGILDPGWVEVSDGRITAVGAGVRTGGTDLRGAILTPGFVDAHVHAGAGATFGVDGTERSRAAAEHHARHGTTTMLAGLRAAPVADLAQSAKALAPLVGDTSVAGLFLEGPFLSPHHSGAQRVDAFRALTAEAVSDVIDAVAPTPLRLITIAPELDGGTDAIRALRAAGATVAVGHTDASYDEAAAAFDAGATVVTHLFNAMRPLQHRDPGPALAAADDPRVTAEIIADGHHLADRVIAYAFQLMGPGRVMLITDAMEATGLGDGEYPRRERTIRVEAGKATFTDTGGLAGSTLTLATAVRRTVRSAGISLMDAVRAASLNPARVLGLDGEVGAIAPGLRADLNVLDPSLNVVATMQRGAWITGPWGGA